MATVPAIEDPRELAYRLRRKAARRRQLALILIGATLAAGYLGREVGSHLIAARWLGANHYRVDWRCDAETWRRGGATAVRVAPDFRIFGLEHAHTDLKFLPWLHRVEALDLKVAVGLRDADLASLGRLTDLRFLNLDRTGGPVWLYNPGRLTDATLARIRPLTRLRELFLGGQNFTDAGLANLAGLDRLESLGLQGNPITDAGLEALRGLPNLKSLDLRGTRVTARGLRAFEAARPGVAVLADHPTGPSPSIAPPNP